MGCIISLLFQNVALIKKLYSLCEEEGMKKKMDLGWIWLFALFTFQGIRVSLCKFGEKITGKKSRYVEKAEYSGPRDWD
jgi:hypothetical protein